MVSCIPIVAAMLAVGATPQTAPTRLVLTPSASNAAGTWRFWNGAEFPGASGGTSTDDDGTLHLAYDFTGGGNYVALHCDLANEFAASGVSFRVKKAASAIVGLRVTDSTGQTVQKTMTYGHSDWQTVRADMRRWTGHWGGADDGIVHQPIRAISILIDNVGLESPTGEVLLSDIALEPASGDPSTASMTTTYRVTDFGSDDGFGVWGPSALVDGVWTIPFAEAGSASLYHSLALFGKPERLVLRAKGTPGVRLSITLGSHFQSFERDIGTLDGSDQVFDLPVPPEGWRYGGGENDGVARFPLRLVRLLAYQGDAPAADARIELAGLDCATALDPASRVVVHAGVRPMETSDGSARAQIVCTVWNLETHPLPGTLELTIRDWEGNVVRSERVTARLPGGGKRTSRVFDVAVPDGLNFVEAECAFVSEDYRSEPSSSTWVRPLDRDGSTDLTPESPWGMGVYLYRYGHNERGHAEMDRAAAMAQAAGVKWSREEFSWARTEPRQGEFDFGFYDVVVDTAIQHGISVYGLLSYWSNWTKAYTEEGIEDFCRWARAVVHRYKDRIHHWEVYNEPNIFFWQGDKELYPVLLKRAYETIKNEDPTAHVLGISTAGIDTRFIDFCLERGAPFDVLTIHPYRSRLSELGLIRELRATAQQVGGRPLWITEMGWSTQVGATSERAQAELLARSYLASVASDACQNVSWYDFRSDGNDPFYNEHNFGVLHHDLTPKAGYRALATICTSLAGGDLRSVEGFGEDVFAVAVGDATAIWTASRDLAVEVQRAGQSRVQNLMGEVVPVPDESGAVRLPLRAGQPLFLLGSWAAPTGRTVQLPGGRTPELIRF